MIFEHRASTSGRRKERGTVALCGAGAAMLMAACSLGNGPMTSPPPSAQSDNSDGGDAASDRTVNGDAANGIAANRDATSGDADTSSGDPPVPEPRAYVDVSVTASATGSAACDLRADPQALLIGTPPSSGGSPNPGRVEPGATDAGRVDIACAVDPGDAGPFSVRLSASLEAAAGGGSLTIEATADATTGGTARATFVLSSAAYSDDACVLSYPTNPPGGPLAPGRIWAHVDCPSATPSAGDAGHAVTCAMAADFVFENCM